MSRRGRGNVPALEYVRATIARDIIRKRRASGLTQEELATLFGVRQETICRLETGLHSPTVRKVEKIERALRRAAAGKRTAPTMSGAVSHGRASYVGPSFALWVRISTV